MLWLLLLATWGCSAAKPSYEGRSCDDAHPCPAHLLCSGGVCGSGYAFEVAAVPGLAGYWRLDESSGNVATDAVGQNSGTYMGGYLLGQPGLLVGDEDTALGLSGAGFVQVPSSSSLDVSSGFTLSAIVRPTLLDMKRQIICKTALYWMQVLPQGAIELAFVDGAQQEHVLTAPGVLAPGVRHHLVGTYDGQQLRLYVDGVTSAVLPATGAVAQSTTPLRLGSWDGIGFFFAGVLDEAFIAAEPVSAELAKALSDASVAPPTRG